jgi:phospholipid-binding lipoprotein MlaA
MRRTLVIVGFFVATSLPLPLLPLFAEDGPRVRSVLDDEEDVAPPDIYDPWEPMNRGIFWFNDRVDVYVLEPVARGYDNVMPDAAQRGVGNFFKNLRYPSHLVSDIIQGKGQQALEHTGQFLINTTLGVVGIFDVAESFGLSPKEEDFATALASYEVPAGPYLVIPFIGPSNVRDGVGLLVDTVLNPLYWLSFAGGSSDVETPVTVGLTTLKFVDIRAGLLDAVETAKGASLDYYLFMQGAYYQYRDGLLKDEIPINSPFERDARVDGDNRDEAAVPSSMPTMSATPSGMTVPEAEADEPVVRYDYD